MAGGARGCLSADRSASPPAWAASSRGGVRYRAAPAPSNFSAPCLNALNAVW